MSVAHHTSPPEGIEATGLVKDYPGDIRALDGVSLSVQPGTIFGLLGPNGQEVHDRHSLDAVRPTAGTATVGHDVLRHPERVRSAIGVVGCAPRSTPAPRAREPGPPGPDVRHRAARAAQPDHRHVRALHPHRCRGPPRRHMVGRHAPQARRRDGADQPPSRAVPRRADDRPRSRGPRRALGGGRLAVARRRARDPADHPLSRGGRPPGRPPRHRRPRPDRRRRHARGPQGRAPRRRDPHRARSRPLASRERPRPHGLSIPAAVRRPRDSSRRPRRSARPRSCRPRVPGRRCG